MENIIFIIFGKVYCSPISIPIIVCCPAEGFCTVYKSGKLLFTRETIINLIREQQLTGRCHILNLLGQLYSALLDGCKVKLHVQVGCTRTTFKIEDAHGVGRIIRKDILSILLGKYRRSSFNTMFRIGSPSIKKQISGCMWCHPITVHIVIQEQIIERCRLAVYVDIACPEVH